MKIVRKFEMDDKQFDFCSVCTNYEREYYREDYVIIGKKP